MRTSSPLTPQNISVSIVRSITHTPLGFNRSRGERLTAHASSISADVKTAAARINYRRVLFGMKRRIEVNVTSVDWRQFVVVFSSSFAGE
jgi:hypothetical protein